MRLLEQQDSCVVTEATGDYWKSFYYLLEHLPGVEVMLVNARHVKTLPGRKTDVAAATDGHHSIDRAITLTMGVGELLGDREPGGSALDGECECPDTQNMRDGTPPYYVMTRPGRDERNLD